MHEINHFIEHKKNIREKFIKSNQKDTIVSIDGKNALQDLEIQIQNKIQNNKVVNKKHNNYSRINENLGELGNSSFSLEKKYLAKKYRKSKKKHINKKTTTN